MEKTLANYQYVPPEKYREPYRVKTYTTVFEVILPDMAEIQYEADYSVSEKDIIQSLSRSNQGFFQVKEGETPYYIEEFE